LFTGLAIEPSPEFVRIMELSALETSPTIAVGTPVVTATPALEDNTGGIGLPRGFANQSRLMVRPSSQTSEDEDDRSAGLPPIADSELFLPFGRYRRVGPGRCWEYLPSLGDGDAPGDGACGQPQQA
jgi:hypothetical protein